MDDFYLKIIKKLQKKYVTRQNPLYVEIFCNGDLNARVQIYRDWMTVEALYNEIIQKIKEIGNPDKNNDNFGIELTILLMAFNPDKLKKHK